MKLDATVLVATYNRAAEVVRCVSCLRDQHYPLDRYEIIVVDDGSTDGTAEQLAGWQDDPRVRLLRLPARKGPGPARNAGIFAARGEVVIFLDSDAFAPPWFVKSHVEAHRRFGRVFVDGPAITIERFAPELFHALSTRTLALLDRFGAEFVTVNASCPRVELVSAGGFDEAFGTRYGWEDMDLGRRLRERGLTRVKHREALVLHRRLPDTHFDVRGDKREECGANALLYYRKYPGWKTSREIRWRYLRYARLLSWVGFGPERLREIALRESPGLTSLPAVRRLAGGLYLVHRYAQGLKQAAAQLNLVVEL